MKKTEIDFNKFTTDPDKGLCYDGECLCDYLEVVALVRNKNNSNWKNRVRFKDYFGNFQVIDIPRSFLLTPVRTLRIILHFGFPAWGVLNPKNKKLIMKYLCTAQPLLSMIDNHEGVYRVPDIDFAKS